MNAFSLFSEDAPIPTPTIIPSAMDAPTTSMSSSTSTIGSGEVISQAYLDLRNNPAATRGMNLIADLFDAEGVEVLNKMGCVVRVVC